MNIRETLKRRENLNKLEFQDRRHINCVRFGKNESLEHALAKLIRCYQIRGEKNFVTEVRFMRKFDGSDRKIDIFVLESGEKIEIIHKSGDRKMRENEGCSIINV